MSRDPGSTWRPLPEGVSGKRYDKTQLIVHSTGTDASAAANARYFAQSAVLVESHFIVGLSADDPTLQVMDTDLKADANTTASRRGISIEVVGNGYTPFTPWQVSEIVRIGRWARVEHEIPARLCPAHDEAGFGWHVMFGAPGPWTTQRGKVCPGASRVAQLKAAVFPAIFRDETPHQEDEMTEDDRKIRNAQHDQLLKHLSADRVTAVNTERKINDLYDVMVEVRDLLKARGA